VLVSGLTFSELKSWRSSMAVSFEVSGFLLFAL
jgi:hypothetical protein